MENLLKQILAEVQGTNQRLARVEQELELVSIKVNELIIGQRRLEQRMDNLEQRMDHLEQRMDNLERRVGHLEQRMDSLERRMDNLEQRMDHLEKRVDHLERKIDEGFSNMKIQMEAFEKRMHGLFQDNMQQQLLLDERVRKLETWKENTFKI